MSRRVPLAWLNLTHSRVRLVLFAAGITFAVVLMFIQYGCRNALLDSSALLLERFRTDLVLVNRQQTTILLRSPFPRTILTRALSVEGVTSVYPVYIEYSRSLLRNTNPREEDREPTQTIRVIGVDPNAYILQFPVLDPNSPESRVPQLRLIGHALFDRLSRKGNRPGEYVYGPVKVGTETDLAGHWIKIVGFFDLGIDFGCDGTLIISTDTFERIFRPVTTPGSEQIDIGLVRLGEGIDEERRQQILRNLRALLATDDVDVLTREEFIAREKGFWRNNTPIGYVFGFGMFMGFLVGLVICYQILSSDIRDNLQAYATLRAIGYPNRYLVRVVLEESLLLAGLGFIPGLAVSFGLYHLLAHLTDLPMQMTPWRIAFIFFLTVGMCVGSALLAVRQAQQADPAEVF